jgi:hypothetical protein
MKKEKKGTADKAKKPVATPEKLKTTRIRSAPKESKIDRTFFDGDGLPVGFNGHYDPW